MGIGRIRNYGDWGYEEVRVFSSFLGERGFKVRFFGSLGLG